MFGHRIKKRRRANILNGSTWSVEPDEATVKQVIKFMGGNSIVFSTDYPHGYSKYPEAVAHFLKVADKHKRKILWDNCAAYCWM